MYTSKPSEKKPSALSKSSYSATGSSNASYLFVNEHRKTAEVRAQRQLKSFEQSLELERQKIKEKVLVARENATLVGHRNLLNERLPKEVKSRSLNAQSQSPQMVSMKI